MGTTWIIAADSSRARILELDQPNRRLVELEDFLNPEARLQDKELQSDAEPRFNGHGGAGGSSKTGGPASDREAQGAVEHSTRVFAREVGRYLHTARTQHRFDALMLVAPPRFLGTLRKELDKEVQKLVVEELGKDLSWFNRRDLERYVVHGDLRASERGSAQAP
jgi:protein required for attachment to host cells